MVQKISISLETQNYSNIQNYQSAKTKYGMEIEPDLCLESVSYSSKYSVRYLNYLFLKDLFSESYIMKRISFYNSQNLKELN